MNPLRWNAACLHLASMAFEKVCFLCVFLESCCALSTQVTDYAALYDRMRQSVTLWSINLMMCYE